MALTSFGATNCSIRVGTPDLHGELETEGKRQTATDTEKYRGTHRPAEEFADDIKLRGLKSDKPSFCVDARTASPTGTKALANLEGKRVFIPSGTRVILSETSQK